MIEQDKDVKINLIENNGTECLKLCEFVIILPWGTLDFCLCWIMSFDICSCCYAGGIS